MRLKLHYWNNISVFKKYTQVVGGVLLATSLSSYANDPVEISGFVENATSVREDRGLSKFRNTLQLEFSKNLNNLHSLTHSNSSLIYLNYRFSLTKSDSFDRLSNRF